MTSTAAETSSVYRFASLAPYPLIQGITTRCPSLPGDGDINVAGRLPLAEAVENRRVWAEEIGVDATAIVCARQIHGNRVHVVEGEDAGRGALRIEDAIPETDALMTRDTGLPIMIYTADCVPAVVYDPVKHAVGLAHAGWRGTVRNVTGELINEMQRAFGSQPQHLIVGIGPSIGPCCYEVGQEVIEAWQSTDLDPSGVAVQQYDGRLHLDLWRANALALTAAGVLEGHIEFAGICTKCHSNRFFSRRAGNGHRGLFATIVALETAERGSSVLERGREA